MTKRICIYINMLLMIGSCQSQKKETQKIDESMVNSSLIENIVFNEANANPNLKNYTELSININFLLKKGYRISDIYKDNKKIKSDTLKSFDISEQYRKEFSKIPNKYLNSSENNYIFGNLNEADEGYLIVKFKIKNKKPIYWSLSSFKKEHPKEIQLVYKMYEEFQLKLNKN